MSDFIEGTSWASKTFRVVLAAVLGIALMVPTFAPVQASAADEEPGVAEAQAKDEGASGAEEKTADEGEGAGAEESDAAETGESDDEQAADVEDTAADEEGADEEDADSAMAPMGARLGTAFASFEAAGAVPVNGVDTAVRAEDAVENTGARVSAYRDAKYGEPPNGDESGAGQHVKIVISFGDAVVVSDQQALIDSLVYNISGGYQIESAVAQGNDLVLVATGTMLPGGQTSVSAKAENGILEGITVSDKPAKLRPIDTIADTGLAFEVVEAIEGTGTTPASTTFKVTHSANVRSMNNVAWLTNGGSGVTGHDILGGAKWTPAHHHTWYNFTLDDSAQAIANGVETDGGLAKAGYTVTASGSNGEFTITANEPKDGEVLSAVVYSDTFLHDAGLALDQEIEGVSMPPAVDISNAVENTGATAKAYRDAAYVGQASTEGCYVEIEVEFPEAVEVTDAEALLKSLDYTISGNVKLDSAKADGSMLVLSGPVSMFPGGDVSVKAAASSGLIQGVEVGGKPAKLKPIQTVGDTGLSIEVVSAVEGTDTTPAATTFKVTGQAQVRSMNNIVWLTNNGRGNTGSSILETSSRMVGDAALTPAHHHMFWSMSLDDSVDAIVDNAVSSLAALGYTVTAGPDGTFNITANTPKAGEILSASTYDDTFLHNTGLAYGADVQGVELPADKLVASPVQHKIDYVLNGGTNAEGNPSVHVEGTTVTLLNPTREGYIFDGWFTDSGFADGTQVSQIPFTDTGDVTVYAKWTENAAEDPQDPTPQDPQDTPADADDGNGNAADDGGSADAPGTGDDMSVLPFAGLAGIAALAAAVFAVLRRKGAHSKN